MRPETAIILGRARGLSLVELLIAIGILAISMMLIAAAFPAGVAMSIAVTDETTAQNVYQKALAEIRDHLQRGDLTSDTLTVMPEKNQDNENIFPDSLTSRRWTDTSLFSWAALVRPINSGTGPLGNLCQVVIIVSRRPSGNPRFLGKTGAESIIPELRSVNCTASSEADRTVTVGTGFDLVPSDGVMIDSETGIAYLISERNDNNTVSLLKGVPRDELGNDPITPADPREFWVVPGPGESPLKSPAVRVFEALLYLPTKP